MARKRNITQLKIDAQIFTSCHNLFDMQNKINISKNDFLMNVLSPKYYNFKVKKANGSYRKIEAPDNSLKQIQAKLNYFLQAVYYFNQTKASFGFIVTPRNKKSTKNIVKNAEKHLGCKNMLKVDFKDFFHQIKSNQVYDIYTGKLFSFDKKTSNYLTKISIYKNRLPMGSPISPVLSNLYSISLDNTLQDWANNHNVIYTRFVDDLTFSSKTNQFNKHHFDEINAICLQHQLKLNTHKTKFYTEKDTKSVTGLILSDTVDIDPNFYKALDKNLQRLKAITEASILMNKLQNNDLLKKTKQIVYGQINFIGTVEGYNSSIYKEYVHKYTVSKNVVIDKLSENWIHFSYI